MRVHPPFLLLPLKMYKQIDLLEGRDCPDCYWPQKEVHETQTLFPEGSDLKKKSTTTHGLIYYGTGSGFVSLWRPCLSKMEAASLARVCSSESCRCFSCSRRWRALSGSDGDRPKEKAFCINVLGDNFFLGETSELPDSCTGNRQLGGRDMGSGARTTRKKHRRSALTVGEHVFVRAHTHKYTHTHEQVSNDRWAKKEVIITRSWSYV